MRALFGHICPNSDFSHDNEMMLCDLQQPVMDSRGTRRSEAELVNCLDKLCGQKTLYDPCCNQDQARLSSLIQQPVRPPLSRAGPIQEILQSPAAVEESTTNQANVQFVASSTRNQSIQKRLHDIRISFEGMLEHG